MSRVEAESGWIDVSQTKPFGSVRQGYTSFKAGDVLFAKITPCMENGKMAVVPELISDHGFGSTEIHVLRPAAGIDPRFVYYSVSSREFRFHAEHNMTGAVGQKRVPSSILQEHEIGLPPTLEQRRIVEKIEALFEEVDRGVESLHAAKNNIELYGQSLLRSAFEGRLTADWRAQNPDKLESPDVLLARIRKERERRYRAAIDEWERSVAEWRKGGKKGRKPAKPKRLKRYSLDCLDLKACPSPTSARLGVVVSWLLFNGTRIWNSSQVQHSRRNPCCPHGQYQEWSDRLEQSRLLIR